jgi:hypothetical protein
MEQIQNQINQWILNRFDWNQSDLEQIDWIWQILDWRRGSNQIQSWSTVVFMGNFALPLSSTRFWLNWMIFGGFFSVWADVSVYGLMCQPDQAPGWQVGSVQPQFCIDELSISWFHLIPWGIVPPWARWPAICINQGTASSSKLVRAGLKGLPL